MLQDKTVALEIDGPQRVDPRSPKIQESIRSEAAMPKPLKRMRCSHREEGVQE